MTNYFLILLLVIVQNINISNCQNSENDEWSLSCSNSADKQQYRTADGRHSLDIILSDIIEYGANEPDIPTKTISYSSINGQLDNLSGVPGIYKGIHARIFTYEGVIEDVSLNTQLKFQSIFFAENGVFYNGFKQVTVFKNEIKINIDIKQWPFDTLDSKLKICGTANWYHKKGLSISDSGKFHVSNDESAKCIGSNDISVKFVTEPIDENSIKFCYIFDYCASGTISYDPYIYYEGDIAGCGHGCYNIYCYSTSDCARLCDGVSCCYESPEGICST